MILAEWEWDWLKQMAQAFDTTWDRKWLRREAGTSIPVYGRPPQARRVIVPTETREALSRKSHPRRTPLDHKTYKKAMMRAAQIVCRAVKAGRLTNLRDSNVLCTDCKLRRATNYEHRDYSKPLEVEPICISCNLMRGPAILSKPVPVRRFLGRNSYRRIVRAKQ
jgi:hypothetical protein